MRCSAADISESIFVAARCWFCFSLVVSVLADAVFVDVYSFSVVVFASVIICYCCVLCLGFRRFRS